MAKASPAASHTPRPTTLRSSSRASVGSSSTPRPPLPVASNSKGVAKRLAYDDDNFTFPDATDVLSRVPDDDLAPLLELPDPADSSSSTTTLISAAPEDAVTASADSSPTQIHLPLQIMLEILDAYPPCSSSYWGLCVSLDEVAAPGDSSAMIEEAPLPDELKLVLAELHGDRDLSPRSKRLVAALVEAATAELRPTATTLRLRRASFWGKVRVWILAVTVATVAAIDIALAVALVYHHRCNYYDDVLPPT
ncbi:hypothetical protein E2562_025680 [Oryza meyeriana var. granulata]|uniref:Uncharacterized protein n=1 Tax=Oryza meyeriana var. granulata TaxID=110450 RepID=A0A6G1FCI2_9ORYZ|nr:hypothetical protein E2562_025680 [Oryza meyeriana var. granulata]